MPEKVTTWHYETGVEEPEILGSGSQHSCVFNTWDGNEALKIYKNSSRNYLKRWAIIGGHRVIQRYNDETGEYEEI